ncbi:MAG: CDP-alcohol phosphatidyltransferase family protein [Acidobacteria bacterium]|nr:CDP-alcohol phosphatidyltransferase family protein [Acidobacteriota bacterium]MBI3662168.1 CDP-alcohol phosphatidyltransferase family protein [Acidobacteriota bacterium]
MVTRKIGEALRWVLYKIVHLLAATGVQPNFLTFFGLVINIVAAIFFARGRFPAAGGVMILAGLFDMVDGRVARAQGRVTKFGAFFDSVIDRYSDLVLYLGLLIHYANMSRNRYAVLVGVAMAGSVMVSYTRARAESLIPECKAGFWERPERIVLLIIGALANRIAPALWLLAIGPNITVIHRIIYTWKEAKAGHFVEVVPVTAPEESAAKPQESSEQDNQARAAAASKGLVPGVAGVAGERSR